MDSEIYASGSSQAAKRNTTDKLLSALSRKYEEKSSQRNASNRNTPQSRDGCAMLSGRNSSQENASPNPATRPRSPLNRLSSSTPTRADSPAVLQRHSGHTSPALAGSHISPVKAVSTIGDWLSPSNHTPTRASQSTNAPGTGYFSDQGISANSTHENDRLRFSSRRDRVVSPSSMDEDIAVNSKYPNLLDKSEAYDSKNESRRSSLSNASFSQLIGSPRSSHATGISPPRTYAVEKELADSMVRKLDVENSSLRAEIKALKEKYNRALADGALLEGKLKGADEENVRLQAELKKERSSHRQKSHALEDRVQDEAKVQSVEFSKTLELLKIEKESMERELEASRKMTENLIHGSDNSKIIAAYKVESATLREEVKSIKLLLKNCEKDLAKEADQHRKSLEDNQRLTEMNNILKEQVEMDSSGTVADKQAKSIERRLKITEERLVQERADRAGKLSEVEEKLLSENAQLQIEVKELNRYLNREKEKLKSADNRVKDLKDQQMSLAFLSSTSPAKRYSLTHKSINMNKFNPEVARIVEQVNREHSLSIDNEEDLIKYLHNREQTAIKRLTEWKTELEELKVLSTRAREQTSESTKLLETVEELKGRLHETETTLYMEISKLVNEKHETAAKLKICEDQKEGMQAELDAVRSQLRLSGTGAATPGATGDHSSDVLGRMHELDLQLNSLHLQLLQLERERDTARAELDSVSRQLEAKSSSLDEAVEQLFDVQRGKDAEETGAGRWQKKVDQMVVEIKSLRGELAEHTEKNKVLTSSKAELEVQFEELTNELEEARISLLRNNRSHESAQLQEEVDAKEDEVKLIKERYNETECKLTETREELILSEERSAALETQITVIEETVSKEKLMCTTIRKESDKEKAMLKHEIERLSCQLELQNESSESLKFVKADLSKDLEVAHVRLAELQTRMVETQAELGSSKDREKALKDECDKLQNDKHETRLTFAQLEADFRQTISEHDQQLRDARRDAKEQRKELKMANTSKSAEARKLMAELELANKRLESKGKEIDRLLDTLQHQEQTIQQLNAKVKDMDLALEDNRVKSKSKVDELNTAVKDRDTQLQAYEKTARDLYGEAKSKMEQEVSIRRLEIDLDELKLKEMRMRSDLIAAEDEKNKLNEQVDKLTASLTIAQEERENDAISAREVREELNEQLTRERMDHERSSQQLQSRLERVMADLKSAEATISATTQTKDYLHGSVASLEKKLSELSVQTLEQSLVQRLAEHKSQSAQQQSEEFRNYESEIESLQDKTENQRHQWATKYKKQIAELKVQQEDNEKTYTRLQLQFKDTTDELERSLEQTAQKAAECAGHKEKVLLLEEKLADTLGRLKQVQESLVAQDELQDKMNRRNLELEVELNEMRGIMSRLDGSSTGDPKIDNLTRAELNRTMHEWSLRLQALFESQRSKEQSASEQEHRLQEQYKLKAVELEGKLKHEQLMHAVTRNQLKAVDEDNAKLRKLIYGRKRKEIDEGSSGKTRAELINEKIAAAQVRAQAMMAASSPLATAYLDDGGITPLGSLIFGSSLGTMTTRFERLNNSVHNNTFHSGLDND